MKDYRVRMYRDRYYPQKKFFGFLWVGVGVFSYKRLDLAREYIENRVKGIKEDKHTYFND